MSSKLEGYIPQRRTQDMFSESNYNHNWTKREREEYVDLLVNLNNRLHGTNTTRNADLNHMLTNNDIFSTNHTHYITYIRLKKLMRVAEKIRQIKSNYLNGWNSVKGMLDYSFEDHDDSLKIPLYASSGDLRIEYDLNDAKTFCDFMNAFVSLEPKKR